MAEILVSATGRNERGKNAARRLRRQGLIPGVVYGGKAGNVAVAVDPKAVGYIEKSAVDSSVKVVLSLD